MSSKPDHAKAKEYSEWLSSENNPSGLANLARAYLDLVKQHGELREAIAQLKPVEPPTFTDDEIDELAKIYEPDDIDGIRGDFKAGFRKAIELIKERVINQPR